MKEEVTLNRKEQNRLVIMNQIEGKKLTVDKAAILLELTPRHIWRVLAAYRKEGASALAHGNRGRKPVNTIEEELRQQVVQLAKDKYFGFNQQHFTEKLADKKGINIPRSTVRRSLLTLGIKSPQKGGRPNIGVVENVIRKKGSCYRPTVVLMIGWKDEGLNYV